MSDSASRKKRRVFVAQIGARRHYAVPRALAAAGMLERLHTDIALHSLPFRALRKLPTAILPLFARRVLGRHAPGVNRISTSPLFGFSASWDYRKGESLPDRWARRNARFGTLAVRHGFGNADTVYAFHGAALEIFRAARESGLWTILDQSAAPYRWNHRMLSEEMLKWPGWEDAPGDLDRTGLLIEREEMEWTLADGIVCGSAFQRDTVECCGGPVERCRVVPYPIRAHWNTNAAPRERRSGKRIRLLFVGTLQLRKGIQYLAEALRYLPTNSIEARLVGPTQLTSRVMREIARKFQVAGSKPRSEIAREYQWADIFVLPTLSEGSANACYEALSAGLAVVTTPNAGSIVEHERNGLLVPVCDAVGLAEAIERLACDDDLRKRLGDAAFKSFASAHLEDYAKALCNVVETVGSAR